MMRAIVLALCLTSCGMADRSQQTYAMLDPASQAQIDSLSGEVQDAVGKALSGNLPGAVASGVKAGIEAVQVKATATKDTPDGPLGLSWSEIIAMVFTSFVAVRTRHVSVIGGKPDPRVKQS